MVRVSRWTVGSVLVMTAALAMLTLSLAKAESGVVSVTVTPSVLAITVSSNGVGFGITSVNTVVSAINAETATNNGSIPWTGLTATYVTATEGSVCGWEAGTPAADTFAMQIDSDAIDVDNDGFDSAGTPIPANPTASGAIDGGALAVDGTLDLDFELAMPISVTSPDACEIGITLTAS